MRASRRNVAYGVSLLAILAVAGLILPAMACDAAWYNSGWGERKPVTIDRTKVVSDQKDFPVLISLSADPDLAARLQSSGNDLIFTLADGTTKIPLKIESYSPATGALTAWVKVPYLSSGSDTQLFMYYQNPSAQNQQDRTTDWSEKYQGNWRKRDIISWVQTEFNNHNNPSTFARMGAQEGRPQAPAAVATPTPTPVVTPAPTPVTATDTAPVATQQWSDCGWNYRKAITIDHTKVVADQADFPVLVNLASDASLAAHAQPSGNDILFTLSDEKTKVPHKIESYSSTSGALVAWVRVPVLSSTTDTVLYMYYGDPSAAVQQDTSGDWSYRFRGTWSRKAIASWVQTKYNNQMNPSTFLSVGPEMFPPQSCTGTPAPTPTPSPVTTVTPTPTPAAADQAGPTPEPTVAPVDPTPAPTVAPVDPTPSPTVADPAPTVTPTATPTPVPFTCPDNVSPLVTPDGSTVGCVALTNDWSTDDASDLVDTVYVTYTLADTYCLKSADIAVTFDSTYVPPQVTQPFDASTCTRSYTFSVPLGDTGDAAYLYVIAHGFVTSGVTPGDIEITSPANPIYYIIQG
ncbi:MAG TPA: DUF2341 domain-containing protein [Methanomicrobiales archaeon]|nr:DUF2341 domain-containing protein [Methanomicrobiales archaeon]